MKSTDRYKTTADKLRIKDAAAYIGVSYRTMQNYIREGRFNNCIIRHSARKHAIKKSGLDRYLESITS